MSNNSPTLLRADFTQRVVVATRDEPWVPSPQHGVERRMLDRIGSQRAWMAHRMRARQGC